MAGYVKYDYLKYFFEVIDTFKKSLMNWTIKLKHNLLVTYDEVTPVRDEMDLRIYPLFNVFTIQNSETL